jgi:glycosyltransferase involved in cell wall biosynthesis
MHVALVSEHASPLALLGGDDAGGQNVHVAELARALGRLGVHVVVHTRRDDPALPRSVPFYPNVTVEHVDAGPPRPIPKDELLGHMKAFASGLARSWHHSRPDVVHSHFWMSGLASLGAARPIGLPVVHTYHALGLEKQREQAEADTSPPQRIAVEEAIARQADALVATTYSERRTLIRMGAAPGAVHVVPCGVDLDQFSPTGPVFPPRRQRPRVVVVSRMVRRKGIGTVIEAMTAVPEAELLVAGGPPAGLIGAEPEGARLATLARSAGVADRVEFLGALPRPEVPPLLRSADVVACCPWYEPFGMVAIEAMACGRPVIASAVGGLAETVVPGETGWLVPPRDVPAVGAALREALGDTSRRLTIGRRAAENAVRYNWDAIGAETLAVMRAAVDQSRQPALLQDRP